jgi:hypothetical protein
MAMEPFERRSGARAGVARACQRLLDLWSQEGPYRKKWESEARRRGLTIRHGEVTTAAVRWVVADHLRECGDLTEEQTDQKGKRPWKDQIYGIWHGRLSTRTLDVIISAFGMDDESETLWSLFKGAEEERR